MCGGLNKLHKLLELWQENTKWMNEWLMKYNFTLLAYSMTRLSILFFHLSIMVSRKSFKNSSIVDVKTWRKRNFLFVAKFWRYLKRLDGKCYSFLWTISRGVIFKDKSTCTTNIGVHLFFSRKKRFLVRITCSGRSVKGPSWNGQIIIHLWV